MIIFCELVSRLRLTKLLTTLATVDLSMKVAAETPRWSVPGRLTTAARTNSWAPATVSPATRAAAALHAGRQKGWR
jgi:hypothetical protein